MKSQPLRVFIASASEGLEVANAVRKALQEDERLQPILWNEGTFKPSLTNIESLESELAQSDFAVLTLTPDDQSISRGQMSMEPRDNVLFELGLFMGCLGRERTLWFAKTLCDSFWAHVTLLHRDHVLSCRATDSAGTFSPPIRPGTFKAWATTWPITSASQSVAPRDSPPGSRDRPPDLAIWPWHCGPDLGRAR
jgi:hypothetical protein